MTRVIATAEPPGERITLRLRISPVEQQHAEASINEMVRFIAQALADEPENVEVIEIQGEHSTIVELKVAEKDRGKVIGRQGRTADAIRTILKAVGRKIGKTYILEIID